MANPTGVTTSSPGSGAVGWAYSGLSLLASIDTQDSDYGSCTPAADAGGAYAGLSHYLDVTFDSENIPAAASIDGVGVNIRRDRTTTTGTFYIKDYVVQLIIGGSATGDNKADLASDWPTTMTVAGYGGASDTWGLTLSPSDFNTDGSSGVRIQIQSDNTTSIDPTVRGDIDVVTRTVYYTLLGTSFAVSQSVQFIPDIGRTPL